MAAPRLVEAAVDHLEQRPRPSRRATTGRRRAVPVSSATSEPGSGTRRPRRRRRPPRRGPGQHVREPLAEPALHAACRHQHQLLGERVGQRGGQQVAQPVGEQVGAIGPVEVKRHRPSDYDGWFSSRHKAGQLVDHQPRHRQQVPEVRDVAALAYLVVMFELGIDQCLRELAGEPRCHYVKSPPPTPPNPARFTTPIRTHQRTLKHSQHATVQNSRRRSRASRCAARHPCHTGEHPGVCCTT